MRTLPHALQRIHTTAAVTYKDARALAGAASMLPNQLQLLATSLLTQHFVSSWPDGPQLAPDEGLLVQHTADPLHARPLG